MKKSAPQFDRIDRMTESEERLFWRSFENALRYDDGAAAREHLSAGFPIYVQGKDTPVGRIEKRHPDGHIEFVTIDRDGEHVVSPHLYRP
jgi:hypothetical protein